MRYVTLLLIICTLLLAGCASEASTYADGGEFLDDGRVTCPNGMVDDPAPGSCGLYTDENNNDICDYSE